MTPVTWPSPNPGDVLEQAAGRRVPGTELGERVTLQTGDRAGDRNDSQTAAPATSPAAPSRAKIPAPTIAPTPMNAACRTERY